MKIYVDLSCDKVSGQQHMQRALKNRVIEKGLFAEKEDADVLVYVQVPFDETIVSEWAHYKDLGKKIVFIHHYMSKSFYERCAVFKIPGLFELIDYHICISKECELYDYLISKVSPSRVYTTELAAAEYPSIYANYFRAIDDKDDASICFVGKVVKGLDQFVKFCKDKNFKRKVILCPDIEKYDGNLDSFEVYTDKKFEQVYEIMSACQFIFCPCVYKTPSYHLETVMQEAIPCGCIPVVDPIYKEIMHEPNLAKIGFMCSDEFTTEELDKYQYNAVRIQKLYYLTLTETLDELIIVISEKYVLLKTNMI